MNPGAGRLARALGAAAWLAACGAEGDTPERAAREFAAAAQRGDVKALSGRLDPAAVERLQAAAAQASDQIGGRRNVEPHEMLQIVGISQTFQVTKLELVAHDEYGARVRLVGADGTTEDLLLARGEDGRWFVRVPFPALAGERSGP